MPGGSTSSGATGATCVGSAPAVLGIVISALPRCRHRHRRLLLPLGARCPVRLRRRRLVLTVVAPVGASARGLWCFVDAGRRGVARARRGHCHWGWRWGCAFGSPGMPPGVLRPRRGLVPGARQMSHRRRWRPGAPALGALGSLRSGPLSRWRLPQVRGGGRRVARRASRGAPPGFVARRRSSRRLRVQWRPAPRGRCRARWCSRCFGCGWWRRRGLPRRRGCHHGVGAVGFSRVVHVGRQMDAGDRAVDRAGMLVGERWRAEEGGEDSVWPVGCAWAGSGVAGVGRFWRLAPRKCVLVSPVGRRLAISLFVPALFRCVGVGLIVREGRLSCEPNARSRMQSPRHATPESACVCVPDLPHTM